MKKIKFLTTLAPIIAISGTLPVVSSCNKGPSIDISGVEHGTVVCSAIEVGKSFTITYTPDEGWLFSYAIITIGDNVLKLGDDYTVVKNVITVYSTAVKSTNVKIVIKAEEDKHAFGIIYNHLLPKSTNQYFKWDDSNPIICEKGAKKVTVKITKLENYTDSDILNPRVRADTSVSISPKTVSLASMSVGDTKEMTFTWTNNDPPSLGLFVDIDYTKIETDKESTSRAIDFIELPSIINAAPKQNKFKFKFKTDQTSKLQSAKMLAVITSVSGGEPVTETFNMALTTDVQEWNLSWADQALSIMFELETTPK